MLNTVASAGNEADEAEAGITALGMVACHVGMVNRVAYACAILYGQGAQEYEPHGKAVQEIEALFMFLCKHYHMITHAQKTRTTGGGSHEQVRGRA